VWHPVGHSVHGLPRHKLENQHESHDDENGALPKPPVNRGRSDDSRRRAYSDQDGRRGADLANEY
jgi:hypothetical protein